MRINSSAISKGLGRKSVAPAGERATFRLGVDVSREDKNRQIIFRGNRGAELLHHIEAAYVRHVQSSNEVGLELNNEVERLPGIVDGGVVGKACAI